MKKKILSLVITGVMVQGVVFSSPLVNGVIPQAGAMNTHDMDTLKTKMIEDKVDQDFKDYKKNRKQIEEIKKQEKKEKKKLLKQGLKSTQQRAFMQKI